jgi:prevent-host-death family protein
MTKVRDMPLRRCRPSEDIVPFSECRNNLSMYIGRVRETHRPVLITQNGRAASYLVDVKFMDDLFDQVDLSRDVEISRREFAEGKGIPHEQVMQEMDEMIQGWIEEDKKRFAV